MAQSPLISIPRKTTSDTDWAGPLRSTIAHSYGENPESYAEEISVLGRCRQDAVRGAGSDTTARDLLYKYFGQLELLELRFAEVKVSFGWCDAFTSKLTTQTSIAFEKASIIHLLASVLSALATQQSRADPEGLKRAYFNSRACAGMLTYINENFLHAPSTDLSRDVVKLLIGVCLAQATEIFLEKLVSERKSTSLISRTASQAASMYNTLVDDMREFQGKGVFDRNWASILQAKAKHFASVAQYQRGLADDAGGKHGAALVRYRLAESLAIEARRIAYTFNYSWVSTASPTLPHDAGQALADICKAQEVLCQEQKVQSEKNNDLIYHDILPSEGSLPVIEKLPGSTPISIQEVYTSPDVAKLIGPDIFSRLIPLAVHESASVYSEEKAKLARAEGERSELAEGEIRAALEHMGLPGLVGQWKRLADGDDEEADVDIPSSLIRLSSDVRAAGDLGAQVHSLHQRRQARETELTDLTTQLDNESRECERARAKYAPNFTQSPSGPQTSSFRQTISQNQSAIQSAAVRDQHIVSLWSEIAPDIGVLAGGPDALQDRAKDVAAGKANTPAPGETLLDLSDEQQIRLLDDREKDALRAAAKEASEKLDRLNKVRREREDTIRDLKDKIQNDDVSNLLLLNRRTQNVEPQLFATELEKFRPYQSRLGAAINASKSIIAELETIVSRVQHGKGVRALTRSEKEKSKRVGGWVKSLGTAGFTWTEVRDGLGKGQVFYDSIDDIINELKREIRGFVQQRDAERNRLVSELETRNRLGSSSPVVTSSGPAPPPPPVPARGLESQFGNLNLGTPPLAPASPYSRPSAYPPPPAVLSSASSGYPAPPKPSSPTYSASPSATSPSSTYNHNPYDFSSLSSLPSAFSTAPASASSPTSASGPAPPPAQPSYPAPPSLASGYPAPPPPPRQQSYSTYPSFPSAPTAAPGASSSPSAPPPPVPPPSTYPQRTPSYGSAPPPPPPPASSGAYPPPPPRPQQHYQPPPGQQAYPSYPSYGGYVPPSGAQPQQPPPPQSYVPPPSQYGYSNGYPAPPPPQPQQPGQYGQPPQHQQGGQYGQPQQQPQQQQQQPYGYQQYNYQR